VKKALDRAAMRFASASHVDRQSVLDVTFENGDHFLVAVESICLRRETQAGVLVSVHPMASRPRSSPYWSQMRIGETGDVLEVPTADSIIEIPWDRIRSIVDPEFRAHLADQAQQRAQRIGGRIRALRLEAGVTPAALAAKVGVSRQVLANVEAGKIEPPIDLIERLTLALGRQLRTCR